MRLVPDWKNVWRWHSTWVAALLAALPMAWQSMPSDIKAYVPPEWEPAILALMFVAFIFGRLRKQP